MKWTKESFIKESGKYEDKVNDILKQVAKILTARGDSVKFEARDTSLDCYFDLKPETYLNLEHYKAGTAFIYVNTKKIMEDMKSILDDMGYDDAEIGTNNTGTIFWFTSKKLDKEFMG